MYPIFFADSAGVLQVTGPGQAECSAVEVSICKHVRETESVEVILGEKLQESFDAIIA